MFGNTVTIVGNLTRDPELRHTAKGIALTNLGVAWNRKYQRDGQEVEDVSFFNVTCWGTLAENVADSNLSKGSRVVVVGRLDQQSFQTREGENRTTVEIVAEEVSPSLKWATAEVAKTSGGGYGGRQGGSQTGSQTGSQGGNQTGEGGYGGSQEAPAGQQAPAENASPASTSTQTQTNSSEEEPF